MLDGNVLAQGHEFFSIGGSAVSSGRICSLTPSIPRDGGFTRPTLKNLTTGADAAGCDHERD